MVYHQVCSDLLSGDSAVKKTVVQFSGEGLWKTAYKVPSLVRQKDAAPLVKVGYSQVNTSFGKEKAVEMSPITGLGANT